MIDNRRGRYPASPFFRMKHSLIFLFIFISTMLFAGGAEEETRIGVAIYDFDDSFITEVRNVITELSAEGIPVTVCDAEGKQQKQNSEIEDFIDKGYDAIIVNSVDRTASGVIIEKCRRSDVPLVFFNREPVREDMARWEKVYYVGSHAEDAGTIAADILAEYWLSHPSADKNGDGILQFVIIKGETGHQDTELRTEYFIETLLSAGIPLEKLHESSGEWKKDKGYDVMLDFLNRSGEQIEAVFANNDDMALGAIEALKEYGYFQDGAFMPVVGVDGTPQGRKALEDGTLLGTVYNDAHNQARAAYNIACILAEDGNPDSSSIGYEMDGKYVWIPHRRMQ